jgi:hypothetical protein
MFVKHEIGYATKRGGQLQLIDDKGNEVLVYFDFAKSEDGTVIGIKPKTKNQPELDYLNANMPDILKQITAK